MNDTPKYHRVPESEGGSTLVPMLVAGLALVVVGLLLVVLVA